MAAGGAGGILGYILARLASSYIVVCECLTWRRFWRLLLFY
jgi:hypothetical protein